MVKILFLFSVICKKNFIADYLFKLKLQEVKLLKLSVKLEMYFIVNNAVIHITTHTEKKNNLNQKINNNNQNKNRMKKIKKMEIIMIIKNKIKKNNMLNLMLIM